MNNKITEMAIKNSIDYIEGREPQHLGVGTVALIVVTAVLVAYCFSCASDAAYVSEYQEQCDLKGC